MELCCQKCFNEKEIIKFIVTNGKIGQCPFCGSPNVLTISTKEIGMFIRAGLNRAYERLEEGTGAIYDSDDKAYINGNGNETTGYSLCEILIEDYDIFSPDSEGENLLEEVIKSSAPSQRSIQQGEIDEYPDIYESAYVLKEDLYGVEATEQYWAWVLFQNLTMYYNRFFDIDDNSRDGRDKLLKSVSKAFPSMNEVLKKGSILHRARKIDLEMTQNAPNLDFYKEISPAPSKFATSNRMSPQGISYTYLATNPETCYSECRMSIDDYAIVGSFEIVKELRILNLSSRKYLAVENSMFSEDYEHGLCWINEFIHLFTMEISRLINPDDKELEYVPTQVMAEYIRKMGYDGIKFESSVLKGTYNYALFCGPNKDISAEFYPWSISDISKDLLYFTKWMRLSAVNVIQISSDTYTEKILYHSDKVYRKDLSANVDGCSEFNCMEDIQERVLNIDATLKAEYKELILDGTPFDFIKYIKELIDADNGQEHYLSVTKSFAYLSLRIDKHEFLYEDKRGASFIWNQMNPLSKLFPKHD